MNNEENPRTLEEVMKAAEVNQAEIARRLRVSTNTVSAWFTGRKTPKADNFFGLCREMKVSPKELARLLRIDILGVPDDGSY
ncbi:helix-turn-helix domain-containing protein [Aerosakkonemataceae cyanobacterium BLCC-F50]|uniref:Helix-turn-helix domain-containing protein n=1 Tax=Floridaenema flaviceps BLCC-F50 TaxID=3153642 RepID=A0ABV4XRH1_9CYAN